MSDATVPKTRRAEEANEMRLARDDVARAFNSTYLSIMNEFASEE